MLSFYENGFLSFCPLYHVQNMLRQKSEKPTVFLTRGRVHMHISCPRHANIRVHDVSHAHFCLRVHYITKIGHRDKPYDLL